MKIFRLHAGEQEIFQLYLPQLDSAIAATRDICQGQFGLPAVLRVSDAEETGPCLPDVSPDTAVEWFLSAFGLKRASVPCAWALSREIRTS